MAFRAVNFSCHFVFVGIYRDFVELKRARGVEYEVMLLGWDLTWFLCVNLEDCLFWKSDRS
jgi:hypothetical protein